MPGIFDLMMEMQASYCFESGPLAGDGCSTTCMLPAGHAGEHRWTRDDEIMITFKNAGEEG